MSWFHKHEWERIDVAHAPAQMDLEVKGNMSGDTALKLAYGVTTFIYKCEVCGKLKKIECLGKGES